MKLGHDFCFVFPVHDSHGAVAPDALPTALIYEDHGGALAYAPTVALIGALTGQYYCYGTASAANGFDVGKDYNIVLTAVISGATWNSRIAQFTIEDNDIDKIATLIGTPVALDGGAATVGGMLTKMADDNGGADFDATTDSLEKIAAAISGGSFTVADVWAYLVTGLEPAGSSAALLAAAASGGSGDIINQIVIPMSKTRNELLSTTVDVADRIAGHGNIVAASSYVIMFSRDGRVTTSDMIRSVTYNADSVGLVIRRGAYSDSPYKLLIMLWMDSNAWIRVECELVIYRALD